MNDTKRILDYNQTILNLNKTKFILVKEHEKCLVWIEKPDKFDQENEKCQRYAMFASITEIYKENQIDVSHQYLLHANDFVSSAETQLASFQLESFIRFILINHNLPVTVIVKK